MAKITPFLWFNNNAADAVEFYLSVFKSGKRLDAVQGTEGGPWPKGHVVVIPFELEGQPYIAFNGGPMFAFTEAISMSVACATQEEIDYYWSAFIDGGGKESQCGWLKDRFGLSWQIVPENIGDLTKSPNAMKALMGMVKLDKAALEAAAAAE